ncbi:MAG: hypothetical protein HQK55_07830, partial [Deltaproteobacteria bacterium]|nr:hypothetical protein [Deltaproteobacteria bacterium]
MPLIPRRINLRTVLVGLGTTALILGRLATTNADPDLWGYLAFGRQFFTNGFPFSDPFAYTPTQSTWVYHEWLTGVLFYGIYHYTGSAGLQLFKYTIGLLTALLVYLAARRRGASRPAAVMGILLISPVFNIGYSPVRAQVFTNLFLTLTILILEGCRHEGRFRRLVFLPAVMVVWANLHGGFLAGWGIMVLYTLTVMATERSGIYFALATLASLLVTLVNPYGLDYWTYLIQAVTMPRPEIDEWHSLFSALTNGEYLWNQYYFIVFTLLTVLAVFSRKIDDWPA